MGIATISTVADRYRDGINQIKQNWATSTEASHPASIEKRTRDTVVHVHFVNGLASADPVISGWTDREGYSMIR